MMIFNKELLRIYQEIGNRLKRAQHHYNYHVYFVTNTQHKNTMKLPKVSASTHQCHSNQRVCEMMHRVCTKRNAITNANCVLIRNRQSPNWMRNIHICTHSRLVGSWRRLHLCVRFAAFYGLTWHSHTWNPAP